MAEKDLQEHILEARASYETDLVNKFALKMTLVFTNILEELWGLSLSLHCKNKTVKKTNFVK